MTRSEDGSVARRDDEITILLTLKDRAAFTARWMSYANATRFPFPVLIADGGADASVTALLSDSDRYPNVRYEYVRYPYDADYPRYYAKVVDALSRITTPYVAMADNDDFFVVDAVRAAATFLSAHADYASCGGQAASFWVGARDGAAETRVYNERVDWKRTTDIASITAATARDRIRITTLSAGDPTFYDLKRTPLLRRQYETVRDLDFKDLFLAENLLWFLNSIAGKTERLRDLYIARQQNPGESSGEVHAAQFGDWLGRMLVPTWSADFTGFVNACAAALADADSMPLDEARAFMITAYRADVAPALLRDVLNEPSVTPMMPLVAQGVQGLVNLPPTSLARRLAHAVYRRASWISSDVIYGIELVARESSDAERERNAIVEFLQRGPAR